MAAIEFKSLCRKRYDWILFIFIFASLEYFHDIGGHQKFVDSDMIDIMHHQNVNIHLSELFVTSIGYVLYYTYLYPRQLNAANILDMIEVVRTLSYVLSKMYQKGCPFLNIWALNEMDRIKKLNLDSIIFSIVYPINNV